MDPVRDFKKKKEKKEGGGSWIFCFRYCNDEKCKNTGFSPVTMPINLNGLLEFLAQSIFP